MTVAEAKTHYQKLAQDAGLSKEETEAVLKAFDNDKFGKAVSDGHQRHDEFSREMDRVRVEKQRLQEWYEKEELPKYQTYQAGLQSLQKYRELYGELGDDDQGLNNGNNRGRSSAGAGMTKDEIDRYLEDKFKQRDGAYVGLTKTAVRISADFTKRFGDVLDVDAVEKLALEKGLPLDQAYTMFIAPKEQAATEARHKDEIEKAKVEAVRDFQSKMKLPVDTRPKEAHPFWDRKTPEAGKSEMDNDRTSREAFMQGWNEHEAELTKNP
jgi:hypothetical protein